MAGCGCARAQGLDFGNTVSNTTVVIGRTELTEIVFVTPHRLVRFDMPPGLLAGVPSVTGIITVGGQASNVFVINVAPPLVLVLDVYDTLTMSEEEKGVDSCLVLVSNATAETVVVVEGVNFGVRGPSFSVALASPDESVMLPCRVCHLSHTLARCVTTASRTQPYNLTVTVAGQTSVPATFDYRCVFCCGLPWPRAVFPRMRRNCCCFGAICLCGAARL